MKKLIAIACVAAMLLAGCGDNAANNGTTGDLSRYPIESTETLTFFKAIPSNLSGNIANYSETDFAKALVEKTGVNIEYIHPGAGQFAEAFNLMLASDELPDIMDADWFNQYPGGPGKAISDQVIIPLNDYKEYAPAYFSFLEENKDLDKHARTDDGDYYGFPLIMETERMGITTGPTVRADWLKDLGLEVPETIEEWEIMLTRFKNEKGATSPFSFKYSSVYLDQLFFAMLGARWEYYVDGNGEVRYGGIESDYKDALVIANRWFKNGLFDQNFVSVEDKMISSQVLNGQTGAAFLSGGREIGQFLKAEVKPTPEFDLVATQFPAKERGGKSDTLPVYTRLNSSSAAISTQCKNPALAAKVLDYCYTEEGKILANFGIEGVSYNMVDGVPTYTDMITDNSEGLSMAQALGMYARAGGGGAAFINMEGYLNQYYALPQQQDALTKWSTASDVAKNSTLPWALTASAEESSEYAKIMNEVNKYQEQMTVKFITGVEPIENFDKYVQTMKDYGIERAIAIRNAQYGRFKNR